MRRNMAKWIYRLGPFNSDVSVLYERMYASSATLQFAEGRRDGATTTIPEGYKGEIEVEVTDSAMSYKATVDIHTSPAPQDPTLPVGICFCNDLSLSPCLPTQIPQCSGGQ